MRGEVEKISSEKINEKIKIKKTPDFEKRFRKSILLLKGEKIYRINETGKIIWDFIDKISIDSMSEIISEEKKLPKDEVKKQIESFVNALQKAGLIEIKSEKQKNEKARRKK